MMLYRMARVAALASALAGGAVMGQGTPGTTQMAAVLHRAPSATVTVGQAASRDSTGQPLPVTETVAAAALPAVRDATLVVRTVPAIAGARITLDRTTYATNARGRVTIPASSGSHRIRIRPPRPRHAGTHVRFARWLDGIALANRTIRVSPGKTLLEAGFVVSHPITVRFTDEHGDPVPLGTITQLTMASSVGQRFTFSPTDPPQGLDANRIVRDQTGLQVMAIRYSVREVVIHSSNVVYGGSQDFYVKAHELTWTIKVLLFPLRIEVRDALFGFPIGSAVQLTLPDHSRRVVTLGADHSAALTRLPRATYQIVAKGFGFGLAAPTTLSRPQVAKVLLFSWVDLAAVLALAMLFVIGLPLVGGRIAKRPGRVRLLMWRSGDPSESPPAEPEGTVTGLASQPPEPTGQVPEPEVHASVPAGIGADQTAEQAVEMSTAADEAAIGSVAPGTAQCDVEPKDPDDSTVVFPAITNVTDVVGHDRPSTDENGSPAKTSMSTAPGRSPADDRRES